MSGKSPQSTGRQSKAAAAARPRGKARASEGGATISAARAAACEILLRVGESDAHSDDLLHSPRIAALSTEDRNLTTALVLGVLRWQIALDASIGKLLARPGQRPAEPVAIALRMGAFQLLHMDRIPPHAAINESVELCRAAGHAHASGMVNAVLRKIATQRSAERTAERTADTAKRRSPIFESTAAFAERLGHPAWLVERWAANYERDAALAICEYGQREPQAGGLFPDPPGVTGAVESDATSLPALPFQMDDGSRLVAELAAAAAPSASDGVSRIWDCCAAPGGKTLVLAQRLAVARILATDISAKRMARMAQRIGVTAHTARIQCEVMDAAQPDSKFGHLPQPTAAPLANNGAAFDLILCDAPCSGTGTLARNPEIRHRLRPEELVRQAARQRALLRGALARLAPGGRLLYSTCSLEPEENEAVVEAVLRECDGAIVLVPIGPLLGTLSAAGVLGAEAPGLLARTALRDGCLRTLPGIHRCDGFFAALLSRN